MIELGVACDGGKDSLSMAAAAGGETVMAPGNLVVSAYVGCPDVTKVGATGVTLGASSCMVPCCDNCEWCSTHGHFWLPVSRLRRLVLFFRPAFPSHTCLLTVPLLPPRLPSTTGGHP